jgi:chromosome segregation ATPase
LELSREFLDKSLATLQNAIMKALSWVLVVILFAATASYFTTAKRHETELARLRQEKIELSQAQTDSQQTASAETQSEDSVLSRKEREELVRLRNEVGQLRRDKQLLTAQVQQVERKNEQLRQAQQSQQESQRELQQLQNQNQQLAQQNQEQQTNEDRNECINNLRQIDGAIQQWALENRQAANSPVTLDQLAPYFKNSTAPVCPGGGVYSVTTVSAQPSCSIPGHTLQGQ